MLPQHSVPHEFGEAKRERHLDKVSAASYGLPRSRSCKTVRSPSTVTVRLKTQVVEDNIKGVIAQGIECSTHGSSPRHSYRIYARKQCHLPLHGSRSSRANILANWIPMKTVPTWPAFTTTWVSRSRNARFLQTLQLVLRRWEGLNVVRLQGVQTYWAYAHCTMPHTSDYTSGRSFRRRRPRHTPCLCQWSLRNTQANLDESLTLPGFGSERFKVTHDHRAANREIQRPHLCERAQPNDTPAFELECGV